MVDILVLVLVPVLVEGFGDCDVEVSRAVCDGGRISPNVPFQPRRRVSWTWFDGPSRCYKNR
jgi:hypothetical protein